MGLFALFLSILGGGLALIGLILANRTWKKN